MSIEATLESLNFKPFPVPQKEKLYINYFDFYIEVMKNAEYENFFEHAIAMKSKLEKEAEAKKEQDVIKATQDITNLLLIIRDKLFQLREQGIIVDFPSEWMDNDNLDSTKLYDATFNNVYLSEEILQEFREYIEKSKNAIAPKQFDSTIEKKYNEYLSDKAKISKDVRNKSRKYIFLATLQINTFLNIGLNGKTLDLTFVRSKPIKEIMIGLKANEESIERVISFLKSLTYEQMKLIIEVYDSLIESKNLAKIYQNDKEKIENEYKDYINNIWYQTYTSLKQEYPHTILLEKRLIIEYYKALFLQKIEPKETSPENFNECECRKDICEAIENFSKINSKSIDEIEREVNDHIHSYFENKLENNKILKK